MTSVVAPNTSGLTPVYPYESIPSQKFYPNLSRDPYLASAPSKSDCKSNTFLLHHQTFCKLFYRKNTPTTTNTMIYTPLSRYIFFYDIEYPIILPYYIATTLLLSGKQQCRGACKLPLASEFVFEKSEIRLSDILRQVSKEDKRRHLSIGQLRNIFYLYVLSFDGGWRVVFYQRQEKFV